jgi:hypothetical protein
MCLADGISRVCCDSVSYRRTREVESSILANSPFNRINAEDVSFVPERFVESMQ